MIHYYTKTVKYTIGGRRFEGDEKGFVLTERNPYVSVKDEDLRDFRMANKRAIIAGLMIPTEEPSVDWDTPNAITEIRAAEIVKLPYLSLTKELEKITSIPHMSMIVEASKEQNRPIKTQKLVEAKLAKLAADQDIEFIGRDDRGGVE